METGYPKLSRKDSAITIKLSSEKEFGRISNIDFILDVDSKTQELIGIEIVNLVEKTGSKVTRLEDFEGLVDGVKWRISYEPEYDVAYVGFQREEATSSNTKQEKGTVLTNLQGNVLGFVLTIKP